MPKPMESPTALAPHLIVDDAAAAIEFYKRAFGAEQLMRLDAPNGKIMHAAVSINGAMVMLVDENREHGMLGPKALNGTPISLHLVVADADDWIARAARAGAKVRMPAADMFWGDRYGVIEDPFGHRWAFATPIRKMTEAEIREAARKTMADGAKGGAR
jgi:uncharacterized glyoxalase superfamily protein PhnB